MKPAWVLLTSRSILAPFANASRMHANSGSAKPTPTHSRSNAQSAKPGEEAHALLGPFSNSCGIRLRRVWTLAVQSPLLLFLHHFFRRRGVRLTLRLGCVLWRSVFVGTYICFRVVSKCLSASIESYSLFSTFNLSLDGVPFPNLSFPSMGTAKVGQRVGRLVGLGFTEPM